MADRDLSSGLKIERNFYVANELEPGQSLLDLASGLIISSENINEILRALNLDGGSVMDESLRRRILESMTHEAFHVQQIVLSGWLFDYVCDWYERIKKSIPRINENSDFALELDDAKKGDLLEFLGVLSKKNGVALSISELVEGQAYIAQKLTHYPNMNQSELLHIMEDDCPNETYRAAFDYARHYLGEKCLALFSGLVYLALCTRYPTSAFRSLCIAARETNFIPIPENYLALLDDLTIRRLVTPLGSGIERYCVRVNNKSIIHPVFGRIASKLNSGAGFNLIRLMADPRLVTPDVIKEFLVPIQAQGGTIAMADSFDADTVNLLQTILCISHRLLHGRTDLIFRKV